MADTDINAYFSDVDRARSNLQAAQAEVDAAEARLADKKRETGYQEPEAADDAADDDVDGETAEDKPKKKK